LGTRVLGPALFLISTSVLGFEVVLLRLFAIQTYHHFAYMVIGVALLGFGASGTSLVVARNRIRGREEGLFRTATGLLPLTLLAAPLLVRWVPFEPTQLLWDFRQWLAVGFLYATLALPFFVAASAIALVLMQAGPRTGRLYAWNMVGSASGGVLAILLLATLGPREALSATAIPAVAAAVLALSRSVPRAARLGLSAGIVALVVLALIRPPWSIRPTPFKGLPQVEAYPEARRVGEASAPTGWVVAVEAPAFRHAPGLSLAYTGSLPRQVALFVDAESAGAATPIGVEVPSDDSPVPSDDSPLPSDDSPPRSDGALVPSDAFEVQSDDPLFLDWLPSSSAYSLGRPAGVLVVGSGGGLEVLNALTHGAERVTAVELVEPLMDLANGALPPGSRPYEDARVVTVAGDARAFVARTSERFDLIVLPASGAFHATAAGVYGTGEDYLNTVEAYGAFLARLAPGGTLAATRWIRNPPRDNVKEILTAAAALRERGVDDVGGALAFVRSWATGTLLVKPDGFGADELESLRRFTRERLFDVDWPPLQLEGAEEGPTFNVLDRPVFWEAAEAAAGGPEPSRVFASRYPFLVDPSTDERPYFGRFLRLGSIPQMLARDRGAWLPSAEWGYLALLATLLQSALLAGLLMAIPVLSFTQGKERTTTRILRVAAYFGAIGLGFVFLEIAAIQRLGLILGHPVYATAATLAALLAFSGLGSALSDRFESSHALWFCLGVAGLALIAGLLSPLAGGLTALPLPSRVAVAMLAVGVPATLMGGPFPLGLRRLAGAPESVAWAWAANGVASVVGTSVSVLLAMELGSRGLILLGGVGYAVAALLIGGQSRGEVRVP
jgi:hypothetical protein